MRRPTARRRTPLWRNVPKRAWRTLSNENVSAKVGQYHLDRPHEAFADPPPGHEFDYLRRRCDQPLVDEPADSARIRGARVQGRQHRGGAFWRPQVGQKQRLGVGGAGRLEEGAPGRGEEPQDVAALHVAPSAGGQSERRRT
jgi:hypothetical protein